MFTPFEEAAKSKSWKPSGDQFFVAMDGDDAGSMVAKKILGGNIEGAKKLSAAINKGGAEVLSAAKWLFRGDPILSGGDDNLFAAPAGMFDVEKIERLRHIWTEHTGGTITVGVGNSMEEASKAMTIGKNTGKDKVVFWRPGMEAKYRKVLAANCNALLTKCREQGGENAKKKKPKVKKESVGGDLSVPVIESLNSPQDISHEILWKTLSKTAHVYRAPKLGLRVKITHYHGSGNSQVSFYSDRHVDMFSARVGRGHTEEARKVLSTVMRAVHHHISTVQPRTVSYYPTDNPRARVYAKMVKRHAKSMGYDPDDVNKGYLLQNIRRLD